MTYMATTVEKNELLDAKQLSAELGVPEGTLSNWRYAGIGPAYIKVVHAVRYRRSDIEAWLSQNTVTAKGA